jgi:murein DD-endopeptidase MepM/ murein hydrolase activator NlpD
VFGYHQQSISKLNNQKASADTMSKLQEEKNKNATKLNALENELQDVDKKIKKTYIALEKTKGEYNVANIKYENALSKYNTAKNEYDEISARLSLATQQLSDTNKEISNNEKDLQDSAKQMSVLARNTLKNSFGTLDSITLLFNSNSIEQIQNSFLTSKTISKKRNKVLAFYRETQGVNQNSKIRLTQVSEIISGLEAESKVVYTKATNAKNKTEQVQQELLNLKNKQNEQAKSFEAQKQAYIKEIKIKEAESKVLNAKIKKQAEKDRLSGNNSAYFGGYFAHPLKSFNVTQGYGWRIHPVFGYKSFHTGIDLGASCSTPVYASAPGKVFWVGYNSAYGNRIEISHGLVGGSPFMTTYSHLSSTSVSTGQSVTRGQKIGAVGTTGYSTGCHLHYEIYKNGATVDPMPYM